MSDLPERVSARNIFLLATDSVAFGVCMAFLGPTTLLPSLIRLLGGSPVVVGALGTIQSGGWLLPQLLAGRWVANRPLVKKYVVVPWYASRASLFLILPALLGLSGRVPHLAIAALLLGFAGFMVGDALSAVGWFDLMAKSVPLRQRGRFTGAVQSVGSLLGVGAGVVVKAILGRPGSSLDNHILLILLAAVVALLGNSALVLIREPRGSVQSEARLGWQEYLPRLVAIVRGDTRFAWLIATQWLAAMADMAGAFYILYAIGQLQIPEQTIGLFVSAGVLGGLLGGLVLGTLGDRKGSARVIAAIMALRLSCPALALLAPSVAARQPRWGPVPFFVLFALAGMASGAFMVGFMNYVLEIAPPEERSLYVALTNTLGGLALVAPLIAGWLVQVASYEALFMVTLGVAALGLALALGGPGLLVATMRRWRLPAGE